ncbi:MAG: hypothetical protein ACI8T1_005266 [Verrucomicrobiales bacterium]|jgi:hypothetical protein
MEVFTGEDPLASGGADRNVDDAGSISKVIQVPSSGAVPTGAVFGAFVGIHAMIFARFDRVFQPISYQSQRLSSVPVC